MTNSVETCPSCHKGALISVEQLPDGYIKHFSCGHADHGRRLADSMEFHDRINFKAKEKGRGRPYLEGTSGEDLYRKTGKWMLLERVIDRAKNWYREIVKDPDTGKIVLRCEEPLSQHRGHGSARKKNAPKAG